ncbi:hypothetical protein BJ742DRAFT_859952 [Cladochytrium replicatum]|nr:hypothetical protein BJ742DRAFT_859952 [Cladochytrium replicatum]
MRNTVKLEKYSSEYEKSLHSEASRLVTRTFALKAIEIDRRIQSGIALSPWIYPTAETARHFGSVASDQPYRKRPRTEHRDPLTTRTVPLDIAESTEVSIAAPQAAGRAKSASRSRHTPTVNLSSVDAAARGPRVVETELKEEVKLFLLNLSTVKRSMQLGLCEPKLKPTHRALLITAVLDVDAIETQLGKLLVDRKRCFENHGAIIARLLGDPIVFDWKVSLKGYDDFQCTALSVVRYPPQAIKTSCCGRLSSLSDLCMSVFEPYIHFFPRTLIFVG